MMCVYCDCGIEKTDYVQDTVVYNKGSKVMKICLCLKEIIQKWPCV